MIFHEEQRFTGGWGWFWAAIILGPGALALLVLLILSIAIGADARMPLLIVAAVEVAELGLLVLVLRTPVIVRVTAEGVQIRVPPFVNARIPAVDIVSVEEVSAGLFRRYGAGVGKRYSDRRARYTVGNDAGVVLERTNGWRLVIGSRYPAELAAAIRELRRPATTDGSERAPDEREQLRRSDTTVAASGRGQRSAAPARAGWPLLASVVAVALVLFAALGTPALAADSDRHQVYRSYRGIGSDDMAWLAVEANAFATVAKADAIFEEWTSESNLAYVKKRIRTKFGRPGVEMTYREPEPPVLGDEAFLQQFAETEDGQTLYRTTLLVRDGEVLWFLFGVDRDDDLDELIYVYEQLEGRRPDGMDATNLLPDLADLPYPMREDRTEVWATPEPK